MSNEKKEKQEQEPDTEKKQESGDVVFDEGLAMQKLQEATLAEMAAMEEIAKEAVEAAKKELWSEFGARFKPLEDLIERNYKVIESASKTVQEAQSKLDKLSQEKANLENRVKVEESVSDKVLKENQSLKLETADAKKKVEDLQARLVKLETAHKTLQTSSENLEASIKTLTGDKTAFERFQKALTILKQLGTV